MANSNTNRQKSAVSPPSREPSNTVSKEPHGLEPLEEPPTPRIVQPIMPLNWLQKELRTLMMSGDPGVTAFPDGDNLFRWIGTIEGGEGTAYEGLKYKLVLEFPSQYPYQAVSVKFSTPCYHPNVDEHGNICLDILKEKWSALYDVRTVLLSIQSLLAEPNIDSPLNGHAADLWGSPEAYKKHLLQKYEQDVRSKQS